MTSLNMEARRQRVATNWDIHDPVVLISSGDPIGIPGSGDQVYRFLPHPEYRYLTDDDHPGAVLAFDPATGWTHFVPVVTAQQRVWEGTPPVVPRSRPMEELDAWLALRDRRPVALLGCGYAGLEGDAKLTTRLRHGLADVRRIKEPVEVERMRGAARATALGYQPIREIVRPGVTERAVQVELEAGFFRGGADRTAYDSIVGSGPNSAVLHFMPTERVLADGEVVLIDAAGEVDGYSCDVTRVYPAGERFTSEQQAIHDALLEAQVAAVDGARAGVSFQQLHLDTCARIAAGLVDFGLLTGTPEGLVERGTVSTFLPHGLGHLIGLGVRDGSSQPPGERSNHPALRHMRLDVALAPGITITVEPGVYFIPALLENPELRAEHGDAVDWDRATALISMGGMRIEDLVHIQADGPPEVLTAAIPK